jgi:hypothetical protein
MKDHFNSELTNSYSRRRFMQTAGIGALALGYSFGSKDKTVIQGFETTQATATSPRTGYLFPTGESGRF